MMISPEVYLSQLESATYEELISARKELIASIDEYEEKEKNNGHSELGWCIGPSPEVRYQCHLDYLSALCTFMKRKYNEEYVWGDKKLSDK